MNRPIKFRVWRYSYGEMIYPGREEKEYRLVWGNNSGWWLEYMDLEDIENARWEAVCNFVEGGSNFLMQFTGFNDKNDKEIYEGDLIKHDNVSEPLEVYWCEATGQWKLGKGEHRHYYGCLFSYPNNLLEVVGNVYEKSELLGDEDKHYLDILFEYNLVQRYSDALNKRIQAFLISDDEYYDWQIKEGILHADTFKGLEELMEEHNIFGEKLENRKLNCGENEK